MVNRDNYLRVKAYLAYLSEVAQLKDSSVRRYWSYLKHLLVWADDTPLSCAKDIQPAFPSALTTEGPSGLSGTLAPSTAAKIVRTSKRFFRWLKVNHPTEFRHLPVSWIEALHAPRILPRPGDHEHEFVKLDEVRELVALEVPEGDMALQRDQAASALLFLSGMRASALASLPLEAIDVDEREVRQWPSLGVRTKNDKAATTYLLEIPDLLTAVSSWDCFARAHLPPTAMWYPPIISQWGEQELSAGPPGKHRNINLARRMRKLFQTAGLPYRSPHKFRHGHAVYALRHAETMADYKAVSMNLMHSDIRVTDSIYALLSSDEVKRRIDSLTGGTATRGAPDGDLAAFIESLSAAELSQTLMAVADRLAPQDTDRGQEFTSASCRRD